MIVQQQQNGNRIPELVRRFKEENGYTFRSLADELSRTYDVSHVSLVQWATGYCKPNKRRLEFIRENAEDRKIVEFVDSMLAAVLGT